METAELMKLFGFTSRDLAANRRGALSLAQQGGLIQRIVFVVIGVAIIVWAISQGIDAAENAQLQQLVRRMPSGEDIPLGVYIYPPAHLINVICVGLSVTMICGLVIIYVGVKGRNASEFVQNVVGPIRIERHTLHIRNFKFDISWPASERLLAADQKGELSGMYIVYYRIKYDQPVLISIERSSIDLSWSP